MRIKQAPKFVQSPTKHMRIISVFLRETKKQTRIIVDGMKDLHDFTERGVKRTLFPPFLPVQNQKKSARPASPNIFDLA
jgi:hypothetical protein